MSALTGVDEGNTGATGAAPAGKLATFEGFLKKAGHLLRIALGDILRYAAPVAGLIGVLAPSSSKTAAAFLASVELIGSTVIAVEQKWAADGSETGARKLADVLAIVEQPVILLFAQAGVSIDAAYVLNLVNGIVALLNAQPDDALLVLGETAA